MNKKVDTLNIPAFKRKRSIEALERKTNKKALKPRKTTRKRSSSSITRTRKAQTIIKELPLIDEIQTIDRFDEDLPQATTGRKVREFKLIGRCEGFFDKIDVAVIKLMRPLETGDIILIEKMGGMFEQEVKSMQVDGKDVSLARTGSDIGIKISQKPKIGTAIYKLA